MGGVEVAAAAGAVDEEEGMYGHVDGKITSEIVGTDQGVK